MTYNAGVEVNGSILLGHKRYTESEVCLDDVGEPMGVGTLAVYERGAPPSNSSLPPILSSTSV